MTLRFDNPGSQITVGDFLLLGPLELIGLPNTPSIPSSATSKFYVDNLFTSGISWRNPIQDPDLVGITPIEPGVPVSDTTYIAYGAVPGFPQVWTGGLTVNSGDVVSWNGTLWIFIFNIFITPPSNRFWRLGIAFEHGTPDATLTGPPLNFRKNDLVQWVMGSIDPTLLASWTFPEGRADDGGGGPYITQGTTVLVDNVNSLHFGHIYLYNAAPTNSWIEISAGGSTASLSSITSATANNALNNADWLQTWNWELTADATSAFSFGEGVGSTGGVNDQNIIHIQTLSGSTANPLRVTWNTIDVLTIRNTDGALILDGAPFFPGGLITTPLGSGQPLSLRPDGFVYVQSINNGSASFAGGPGNPGGNLILEGGPGTGGGAGGDGLLKGGDGDGAGNGGTLSINGGNANTSGTGGAINVVAGSGGNAGIAGDITISGGFGASSGGDGGSVTVQGGSPNDGNGGVVTIRGRDGVGVNAAGGAVLILSGAGSGTFPAANISLNAGSAGGSGDGGNIILTAGGSLTGTQGDVLLRVQDGGRIQQQTTGTFSVSSATAIIRTNTTNATITEMFLDGTGGTKRLVLPNNSTWNFEIRVVARRTDATDESFAANFEGAIDRQASAATTAIVGGVLNIPLADDSGGTWLVTIDADTTNGALRVQVTGEIGKTIRWTAFVRTVEVTN